MPSSKVTNEIQLKTNKLKNKKTQLENLLRARARQDYEIQKLKKSIAKDSKRVNKLQEEANRLNSRRTDSQLISESLQISDESSDAEEELYAFLDSVFDYQSELASIAEMLLEFQVTNL